MVRLVSTSNIHNTLESLGDVKHAGRDLPLELLETIQQHLESKPPWVEHKLLAQIARWNKARSSPSPLYTLRNLIRGSEVYIEPPVVKERSAELEAILAPIRLAQEQEAYATMLSSSRSNNAQGGNTFKDPFDLKTTDNWDFRSASHPQLSVKQEWEAVRRELSAVVNVIASMGAVATAVWWATGTAPLVQKTLLSLFGALAIAAIEAFLYIRFFQKTRAIPKKKKKEKQQVGLTTLEPVPLAVTQNAPKQGKNTKGQAVVTKRRGRN